MKAIAQNDHGTPDVLELKEIDNPVVGEDDVLIRVHAAALNAGDYSPMSGSPWLARFTVGFPKPKDCVLGWDAAGHVVAVGERVEQFQTLAEYTCAPKGQTATTSLNWVQMSVNSSNS